MIGFNPPADAPRAIPINNSSLIASKRPPNLPTSSPKRIVLSSALIISRSALLIASANFIEIISKHQSHKFLVQWIRGWILLLRDSKFDIQGVSYEKL